MVLLKKALWVGTISLSDLRGYWTKDHRTSFAERERNAMDELLVWFWISLFAPEIAVELWSRPKSGQTLHVSGP